MKQLAPNREQQTLKENATIATVIVLIMNLLSRILGFLREMVIARIFGATMYTDAYLVAYSLPYSVQQVIGWAIVSVTVPLLTKCIVDGKREETDRITNYFLNSTACLMLFVSVIGVLCAPLLVKITAPSLDAPTTKLAVEMTRVIFPSVFFVCVGMVFTGILNANRRFGVAAFAPALSNIIIIATVLFGGKLWGIWGLAIGTLVSFVFFMLIQLPSSFGTGWHFRFVLPHHNREIRTALLSLIPIILGMSVNQIYYILNRFFASGLAEGSISTLNYAAKLSQFPAGVFVSAIAVAIYPLLTEYAICGDLKRFQQALEKGLGVVMLLATPAAIGLIVLRVPIVRLLFEHGAFTATDTKAVASALMFYAVGLVAYSLIMVLLRVFFAFSDVKIPVIAGLCGILVNVFASIVSVNYMGHNGLALATTMASIVNMLVFFLFLRKHLPQMDFTPFLISCVKIIVASLLMGIIVDLVNRFFAGFGDVAVILLGMVIGICVYFLLAVVLRMREWLWLKEMVRNKMGKRFCR